MLILVHQLKYYIVCYAWGATCLKQLQILSRQVAKGLPLCLLVKTAHPCTRWDTPVVSRSYGEASAVERYRSPTRSKEKGSLNHTLLSITQLPARFLRATAGTECPYKKLLRSICQTQIGLVPHPLTLTARCDLFLHASRTAAVTHKVIQAGPSHVLRFTCRNIRTAPCS